MSARWLIHDRMHDFTKRGWIMGVLNVTPDSFSDGAKHLSTESAVKHGLQMIAEGASVIDVGGESTRPGAQPVPQEEELRRVIPVIESLRSQTQALISIDTIKPDVAHAAIAAGADIINDVSGFRDQRMIDAAASTRCGLIVMHMQGTPQTMQQQPRYENVTREVREFFQERLAMLTSAGIHEELVSFDPGIGFGKLPPHNLELLRNLASLRTGDRPLVLGVSRKSFIGRLLDDMSLECRDWPTVALTAWMREAGADVIRVHDVRPNVEALRMIEAIHDSDTE